MSALVQVNGIDSKSFIPERGLRQGDSIYPYLFILCAEAFSWLISKGVVEGELNGVKVARNAPPISHLLFANDSILFPRSVVLLSEF